MQNAVSSTSSDHLGSGVMMRVRRHARTADPSQGSRAPKQPASKPVEACALTAPPNAYAEAGVSHFW